MYEPYQFLPTGSLHGANLAVRYTALREVDGFDARLGAGTPFPCEDIDLIGRLSYAGFKGCFDPRAIIYHHGRKTDDIPKLMKGYDAGRGAYYIRMLSIPKARKQLVQYLIKKT